MIKKNIVLIGFMGTGKTTVGRIISNKIGYNFIDTDEEVEKICNLTISEIFKLKGEKYFRQVENQVISRISNFNRIVISCGGGAVKNADNVSLLKRNGLLVCLKADPETIFNRISYGDSRPLVMQKTKDDVFMLIKEREQLYNIADVFIDTTEYTPPSVSLKIIDIFKMQRSK